MNPDYIHTRDERRHAIDALDAFEAKIEAMKHTVEYYNVGWEIGDSAIEAALEVIKGIRENAPL